jgi:hypothetical protein
MAIYFRQWFSRLLLIIVRRFYPNQTIKINLRFFYNKKFITHFFPWGGHYSNNQNFESQHKIFDVCLFATLDQQISNNFNLHDNYQARLSEKVCIGAGVEFNNFENNVISMIDRDYSSDIIHLISNEMDLDYFEFTNEAEELAMEVDSFLKRYRRLSTAKKLLNIAILENLNIAIFETGWENLGELPKNINLFGYANYMKQFEVFNLSKAVLNTDPNWSSGVHDRVFNSFGSNCVALTNRNKYTDMYFSHRCESVIYESTDDLHDNTLFAIENYEEITKNAYRLLVVNRTWKDRCSKI